MTLSDLTAEIIRREAILAPGSETILWGEYNERMRQVTGVLPQSPDAIDAAGNPVVADDECAWWLAAYDLAAQGMAFDDIVARLS